MTRLPRAAHTILEVLIAVALFAVAALGVLGALSSGQLLSRQASEQLVAANAAETVMETLLALEQGELLAQDGARFDIADFGAPGKSAGRITVKAVTTPANSGLLEITVAVVRPAVADQPAVRFTLQARRARP